MTTASTTTDVTSVDPRLQRLNNLPDTALASHAGVPSQAASAMHRRYSPEQILAALSTGMYSGLARLVLEPTNTMLFTAAAREAALRVLHYHPEAEIARSCASSTREVLERYGHNPRARFWYVKTVSQALGLSWDHGRRSDETLLEFVRTYASTLSSLAYILDPHHQDRAPVQVRTSLSRLVVDERYTGYFTSELVLAACATLTCEEYLGPGTLPPAHRAATGTAGGAHYQPRH